MRIFSFLAAVMMLGCLMGCGSTTAAPELRGVLAADSPEESGVIVAVGKTQAVPGRLAQIAPAVLHPVEKVLVTVGTRVKKDQPLVEIDKDEPEADVKSKEATWTELKASLNRLKAEPREEEQKEAEAHLKNATISTAEARALYDRLEPLSRRGAISEQRMYEARHAWHRTQMEEDAARARLFRLRKRPFDQEVAELEARIAAAEQNVKAAKAELEHYTVTAAIDGVVSTLNVYPGTVSRPGTTVWGEILDLSEIDVRCELTAEEANRVSSNQTAEVLSPGRGQERWTGKVVFVGIAADPKTGRVPVLVRVSNLKERLRCYVEMKVSFAVGPEK